ncbi:MAG: pseudouridine synthase [Lachnospiraceae bacterium]|nr:pseudouridine synthase [Lachnospiraceae bacterium]
MSDLIQNGVRINKYISDAGLCSRREADKLISQGSVLIDGRVALNGEKVFDKMIVSVNGKEIRQSTKKVYLAYNKPKGIVCTSEKREKNNIIDTVKYPVRITYAGRLDKSSEGLIILTNDGELTQALMRGANGHEKEYVVTVDKSCTKEFISSLRQGVFIPDLNVTTRPCKARKITDKTFEIILTQGLNRQIRRMCEILGYRVRELKRVRINNILLNDLKTGQYREIKGNELEILKKSVGLL